MSGSLRGSLLAALPALPKSQCGTQLCASLMIFWESGVAGAARCPTQWPLALRANPLVTAGRRWKWWGPQLSLHMGPGTALLGREPSQTPLGGTS